MNKKAFTLIELISIIAMLGVILLFALPNITTNTERNKKDAFINDAKDMISKAKSVLLNNKAFYPDENEFVVFSLNFIDKREEIVDSKYGTKYNRQESFVAVEKKNNEYKYYVSLVSCNQNQQSFNVKKYSGDIFSDQKCDNKDAALLIMVTSIIQKGTGNNITPKYIKNVYTGEGLDIREIDINQDGYINLDEGVFVEKKCTNIEYISSNTDACLNNLTNSFNECPEIKNAVCSGNIELIELATLDDLNGENKYTKIINSSTVKSIAGRIEDKKGTKSVIGFYY